MFATVNPRLHVVGTLCVIDVLVNSAIVDGIPLEDDVESITTLSFESKDRLVPVPAISLRNIPLLNKTVPVPDVVTILSCLNANLKSVSVFV